MLTGTVLFCPDCADERIFVVPDCGDDVEDCATTAAVSAAPPCR